MNARDYAIYALYPNVFTIQDGVPLDREFNPVTIDDALVDTYVDPNEYRQKRINEYPDFHDYLDGIVKGDQTQIQKYIDACNAVKLKYPKP